MSFEEPTSSNIVPLPPAEGGITAQVYQRLLQGIERRDYRPGRQMDERGLAEAMSVSRTPLRNALSRLLGEGYLERLPNGSLAVCEVGADEVLELLAVRQLLEPEAAAQAAGRVALDVAISLRRQLLEVDPRDSGPLAWQLGDRIHDLVVEHCGNQSLARIVIDARRRIHMSPLEEVSGRFETARAEHVAILDALVRGDRDEARRAMAVHLANSRAGFLATFGIGQ
ncbi:GntR family transcriptional regulator (plasmid) [Bosea sp. F3-2]|uniref:GntR family transcriptional regulator n=1 Tax=Bosea sp. F3-2 TaxID=2599640 RepID=UPI0011EDA9FA|nr:GntR family transcriptional regulator [Bosea sp. F3-2]QEL27114.1 GntR family transcriptional regulator [Bosea sp. F3-2]